MKLAMVQEPIKIPITDSEALLVHSKIMVLRTQHHNLVIGDVEDAERTYHQAEMQVKKAKLALETAQLEAEWVALQEQEMVTDFYTMVRNTHPHMKTLQERYGRGVSFMFDSDHHDVWVIAIFDSNAPPILRDDTDFEGEPYDPTETDETMKEEDVPPEPFFGV